MLLRSVAIRRSVFLAIWNSTLAARILLRKSVISLTVKPWVCTRIVTAARPNFSVSSSIFSAFACVGMVCFPSFPGKFTKKTFGNQPKVFRKLHNRWATTGVTSLHNLAPIVRMCIQFHSWTHRGCVYIFPRQAGTLVSFTCPVAYLLSSVADILLYHYG